MFPDSLASGFDIPSEFWKRVPNPPDGFMMPEKYMETIYKSYLDYITAPLYSSMSQGISENLNLPNNQMIPPQIPKLIISFSEGSNIQHVISYYLKWKKQTTFDKLETQKIFYSPSRTSTKE